MEDITNSWTKIWLHFYKFFIVFMMLNKIRIQNKELLANPYEVQQLEEA